MCIRDRCRWWNEWQWSVVSYIVCETLNFLRNCLGMGMGMGMEMGGTLNSYYGKVMGMGIGLSVWLWEWEWEWLKWEWEGLGKQKAFPHTSNQTVHGAIWLRHFAPHMEIFWLNIYSVACFSFFELTTAKAAASIRQEYALGGSENKTFSMLKFSPKTEILGRFSYDRNLCSKWLGFNVEHSCFVPWSLITIIK